MHGYYRLQSTQQRLRHDTTALRFFFPKENKRRAHATQAGAGAQAETHKTTQHALPIDRLSAADGGAGRLPPATPFRMQQPAHAALVASRASPSARTDGRRQKRAQHVPHGASHRLTHAFLRRLTLGRRRRIVARGVAVRSPSTCTSVSVPSDPVPTS